MTGSLLKVYPLMNEVKSKTFAVLMSIYNYAGTAYAKPDGPLSVSPDKVPGAVRFCI